MEPIKLPPIHIDLTGVIEPMTGAFAVVQILAICLAHQPGIDAARLKHDLLNAAEALPDSPGNSLAKQFIKEAIAGII